MQSKKPRPRLMQAALFTLSWSREGKRALGEVCPYGRSKGRLCYDKGLKIGLCRFMGIEHKQAVRYLNDLKKLKWIHTTRQFSLDGKLEYRLAPAQYLTPGDGEKFIKFNLSRAGLKGFDIFGALEKALFEDSHPAEHDAPQLKFNIPARTRRKRKQTHKTIHARKAHKTHKPELLQKPDRQKVTPVYPLSFSKKENTTLPRVKKYDGQIWIKISEQEKTKVPWFKLRELSEFQKVRSGLATADRAVWHRGRVFRWSPAFSGYELVPKGTAKSDPPVHKPPESQRKIPTAKSDPCSRRFFRACLSGPRKNLFSVGLPGKPEKTRQPGLSRLCPDFVP